MNEEQLRAKMDEYLSTLDDDTNTEVYCTYRELAQGEFEGFWIWLDRKTYAHSNARVYANYTNRTGADDIFVAEFAVSTQAEAYAATMNGVKQ